jgi:hypothetical protein
MTQVIKKNLVVIDNDCRNFKVVIIKEFIYTRYYIKSFIVKIIVGSQKGGALFLVWAYKVLPKAI